MRRPEEPAHGPFRGGRAAERASRRRRLHHKLYHHHKLYQLASRSPTRRQPPLCRRGWREGHRTRAVLGPARDGGPRASVQEPWQAASRPLERPGDGAPQSFGMSCPQACLRWRGERKGSA
eukprot:scaffold1929_cov376-Prasinococcus_capsulatus_cf.AAC.7